MKRNLRLLVLGFAFSMVSVGQTNQARMNDAQLMELKGKVRHVVEEGGWTYRTPSGSEDIKREKVDEARYDASGQLTEYIRWGDGRKEVYSKVDGFKTFKAEDFDVPGVYKGQVPPLPGSTPDTRPRDLRFTVRFEYKYDPADRIAEEKRFLNNGDLLVRTVFSYDERGRNAQSKSYVDDALHSITTEYYDEKGTLFLETYESVSGTGGERRTIRRFSEYVFDKAGNWIERSERSYSTIDKTLKEIVIKRYRTITYY